MTDKKKAIEAIKQLINSQKTEEMKRIKAAEMLLERYKFVKPTITPEEKAEILIDSIAVLISDCEIERKYAAALLIKYLLPVSVSEYILNDKMIYPISREDSRVAEWAKEVKKKGRCEVCGNTEHLEAHHIIKWCAYPAGRIDIANGRCLCHKCHTEQHYGDQSYNMMAAKKFK